jgi:hypothetical protein
MKSLLSVKSGNKLVHFSLYPIHSRLYRFVFLEPGQFEAKQSLLASIKKYLTATKEIKSKYSIRNPRWAAGNHSIQDGLPLPYQLLNA